MSFTPDNPDWDSRFGPKKNPSDSLRDLFGADKVEFEPIDDDEDDIKPLPVANAATPANDKPELADSGRGSSQRPRPPQGRPHPGDSKRNQAARAIRPEKTIEPAAAAPPETTKPTTSHWDLLASTLGLKSDDSKPAKHVESKRIQEPTQGSTTSPAREPKKHRQPEHPATVADDVALHELFVPSGEEFPVEPPRVIDDVTADEGTDFIEFEVEDLVPHAPKRDGEERKPRRRRRRRGDRTANTNDSADTQGAGVDEPPSNKRSEEPQQRTASRSNEPRERGRRRPEQDRKQEQPAQGNRSRRAHESAHEGTDLGEPRNASGRNRGESTGGRGDADSRGRGRSRGAASDESRSHDNSGSRDDSGKSRSDSGRSRNDSKRASGSPSRSRDDSGRSRSDLAKAQSVASSPRDNNFDEEDDFVEIQDNSTNVEKNITTWRQAISVIVEANIESRSKTKSGGNRGKPRNDRDHRRR